MRSFIVMGMFVAGFAQAGWKDFEEQRELSLTDVNRLEIKAGAGSMDINGVPGSSEIKVTATIVVPGASDEKARDIIEEKMVLSLEQHGDSGHLDAWFEESFMGWRSDAYIVLDIDVPPGTSVAINDGAGSIDVIGVGGDVTIDDGSGSIDVKGAAAVRIEDGSGSITVEDASDDVSIVDGSGSITVKRVNGSVTVDDGSGSIKVSDIERDFVVLDDGSGGIHYRNVGGTVDADS